MEATQRAARHARYERRLRSRVKSERGCLGTLPATTRELLTIRAGLDGTPHSRSYAAEQLGISRRQAARLEHSGLRALHVACGGHASQADPHTIALVNKAPALQPAAYLPVADAPSLQASHDGTKADARSSSAEEPKSDTSGTHPFTGGDNPTVPTAAVASDETGSPALTILMACLLAALAALMLVALRHRMRNRPATQGTVTQATAVAPVAPPARQVEPEPMPVEPEPAREEPEPVTTTAPTPSPAEPTPHPTAAQRPRTLSRSAGVVASGLVSFAVRELVKRRGRGGRRR